MRSTVKNLFRNTIALLVLFAPAPSAQTSGDPLHVTADNFARAESHRYFSNRVKQGGFGKLIHLREPQPLDSQTVVRGNRDTLYSPGVFDLDAGPVTITLPNAGTRYMSMFAINEDEYCTRLVYEPRAYTFTRTQVGTRYMMVGVRTLFDPTKSGDIEQAHKLQDAIKISQPGGPGRFDVPNWDEATLDKTRGALLILNSSLPDSRRMFGSKDEVEPVRHLIGAAAAWGGNHESGALYLNRYPARSDGNTIYKLTVKDVPVDAFWSISLYNAEGYFQKNALDAYTVSSVTGKKDSSGAVVVQFGGCDGKIPNCLPIMPGWNYMVRLYRPRKEILDNTWKFPEAQPAN